MAQAMSISFFMEKRSSRRPARRADSAVAKSCSDIGRADASVLLNPSPESLNSEKESCGMNAAARLEAKKVKNIIGRRK